MCIILHAMTSVSLAFLNKTHSELQRPLADRVALPVHGYLDRDALRRAESRPDSARERLLQGLCSFSGRAHRPGAAIAAASCRITQSVGAGSESWARGRHSRRRAYGAAIATKPVRVTTTRIHGRHRRAAAARAGRDCGAGACGDADTGQARGRMQTRGRRVGASEDTDEVSVLSRTD